MDTFQIQICEEVFYKYVLEFVAGAPHMLLRLGKANTFALLSASAQFGLAGRIYCRCGPHILSRLGKANTFALLSASAQFGLAGRIYCRASAKQIHLLCSRLLRNSALQAAYTVAPRQSKQDLLCSRLLRIFAPIKENLWQTRK